MKLMQQPISGTAENLPATDNSMATGEMGGCVSVIVLWDLQSGVYQNVRGFHGGGGIQAVNFASLLNGVPAHATTCVYVFSGPDNGSHVERQFINRDVRANVVAQLGQGIVIRNYHGVANATVDRSGKVTLTSFTR